MVKGQATFQLDLSEGVSIGAASLAVQLSTVFMPIYMACDSRRRKYHFYIHLNFFIHFCSVLVTFLRTLRLNVKVLQSLVKRYQLIYFR